MFSSKKMLEDLRLMDTVMQDVTGLKPRLFRPPYGVTNPNLGKAIKNGNYIPIGWNVRSMDTVIKDESILLNRVSKALKPGAIVLFHDTSKTTLAILPAFLRQAAEKGYKIVRLDSLLNVKAYA
jgi:peptidoglycan/xylan/chitin deacetylase (PgdA/CDA1 family)